MGKKRYLCETFEETPKGKGPLGKPGLKCVDNI
jgi:hypothetical protein